MAYVGYSNVANQAPTTPGCASGVVADANNGSVMIQVEQV